MSELPFTSLQHEAENFEEAIELCYQKGWTDGLPVVPPTEGKVVAALGKAGLAPSDVLGVVPVRGRVVTAPQR